MKIKIKVSKKADEAQSSAQIVASIDDLLTEIFVLLPMKSLIRSKLVSRHWHSLITNPGFCLLRNPDPNPAVGLFLPSSKLWVNPWYEYVPFSVNRSTNPPFRILNFIKDPSGIKILQSCNGLLLCCSNRARDHYRTYYIYNPTTKKYSTLPELDGEGGISTRIHGMSLVFDPSKSPHYKVVCVQGLELDSGEYQYQFEVYSSETGPWRKCGEPFTSQVNFEKGVYWNGSIHWISNGLGDSLYFNPDDQMLQIMPLPPTPDGWNWRSNYYFGESCDHLHYIEIFGPEIQFNVYEMKRDYSEWFVKYQVDLSPVFAAYPVLDLYYALPRLTLVRGEKEEDSFLVLHIPGKAIRYNLVYRTFVTVYEYERYRFPGPNGFQYLSPSAVFSS